MAISKYVDFSAQRVVTMLKICKSRKCYELFLLLSEIMSVVGIGHRASQIYVNKTYYGN